MIKRALLPAAIKSMKHNLAFAFAKLMTEQLLEFLFRLHVNVAKE